MEPAMQRVSDLQPKLDYVRSLLTLAGIDKETTNSSKEVNLVYWKLCKFLKRKRIYREVLEVFQTACRQLYETTSSQELQFQAKKMLHTMLVHLIEIVLNTHQSVNELMAVYKVHEVIHSKLQEQLIELVVLKKRKRLDYIARGRPTQFRPFQSPLPTKKAILSIL